MEKKVGWLAAWKRTPPPRRVGTCPKDKAQAGLDPQRPRPRVPDPPQRSAPRRPFRLSRRLGYFGLRIDHHHTLRIASFLQTIWPIPYRSPSKFENSEKLVLQHFNFFPLVGFNVLEPAQSASFRQVRLRTCSSRRKRKMTVSLPARGAASSAASDQRHFVITKEYY